MQYGFLSKTKNNQILYWLKNYLSCGYIRHRKTGISDYTIVEPKEVKRILKQIEPYVILKKKHVELSFQILDRLPKVTDTIKFLELCQLVDSFKNINYSKKRQITSEIVEKFLRKQELLTPVETVFYKENDSIFLD